MPDREPDWADGQVRAWREVDGGLTVEVHAAFAMSEWWLQPAQARSLLNILTAAVPAQESDGERWVREHIVSVTDGDMRQNLVRLDLIPEDARPFLPHHRTARVNVNGEWFEAAHGLRLVVDDPSGSSDA